MKDTNNMNLVIILLSLLFTIFNGVLSKAIINIRIFNYKNKLDITHDGKRCEALHWANDYCDPMFEICLYTKSRCDTLNKKIDHWRNKQTLFSVLNQNIELQNVERKFTVSVRIDDHDRFDVHDFIGAFTAEFNLENFNQVYRQSMKLEGKKRNINLDASLMIKCAAGFFGSKCDEHISECQKNCVGGICVFNKEKEIFICQCKQGWSGDNCKEFKTDNCKLLNCKLRCNKRENINHCVCIDKLFQMSCQEPIRKSSPFDKIITTHIQYPSTKETTLNTATHSNVYTKSSTKVSTKVSTKISTKVLTKISTKISTEIDKNFRNKEKTNSMNETSKFENMKGTNSNSASINSNAVFQAPSTIIIISLLLLLCICIISLLIVIRNMQEKGKTNFTHLSSFNRPLPPILFQRHIVPTETFKSHIQKNHYNIQSNSLYETCTIPSTRRSNNSANTSTINHVIDNIDPYEEPIINNMESLTCETDFIESDESDAYEIPTNINKSTNF